MTADDKVRARQEHKAILDSIERSASTEYSTLSEWSTPCPGCSHDLHPLDLCTADEGRCECLAPNFFKGELKVPREARDAPEFDTRSYLPLATALHSGFLHRAQSILNNGPARDDLVQLVMALRELETSWSKIWDVVHHKIANDMGIRGYDDRTLQSAEEQYAHSRSALSKVS